MRLAPALIAVSLLLSSASAASATPPPITEGFATGDQGWAIYEGASEYPATWVATGGNPGGFIRYSDADSASSNAAFADEDYVRHISRYEGWSDIVFSLRTSAAAERSPRVWITQPEDPSFPAIHTDLDRAPGTDWQGYSVPLNARATRWVDASGDRVGARRFRSILDRDPVYSIRADYSTKPGEQTDLDEVGLQEQVPRELSLRYKAKARTLKGRLTTENPDNASCVDSQKVLVFKVKDGTDKRVGKATTTVTGAYSIVREQKLPHGKYYADAPPSDPEPGNHCLEVLSARVKSAGAE